MRIDYRDILIHALSRGDSDRVTQKPCLYLQLDETAAKAAQQSVISSVETPTDPNGAGGNVAQDEEETVFEMRIVPAAGDAVCKFVFSLFMPSKFPLNCQYSNSYHCHNRSGRHVFGSV